ncbi:hypothetical protein [Lichenibacterium ramalinae]|uniref:Zinc finger/thioredoxin putative domain-containing protein n=1 Tax=Lichenibacterium ramalinae TaxID=2316527 RepID=A0A4Q2RLG2_9HYPH|nr:hypothetical protein [Lichenibacterium ramalinae]RYB07681.1 hypothetical protein D3272_00675 [Lichenibacterium ramalinae]
MLVRCPTCASGYDIALELLPAGQILRCAHCRDAWVFDPPPAAAVAPPRDTPSAGPEIVAAARFSRRAPARAAAPKRDTRGQQRGSRLRLPPGVAASVLAVALLGSGMAAVAAKASLVAAFPPSQAVFATLGLPVNLSGLSLGEIRSTIVTGDGPPTLTLEGQITNLRAGPTAVPALRIVVRDKSRRELYYWTSPAPKAQLAVGETVQFRSRLSAPPRDGQDLAVSFAEAPAGARHAAERHVAEVMPGDR